MNIGPASSAPICTGLCVRGEPTQRQCLFRPKPSLPTISRPSRGAEQIGRQSSDCQAPFVIAPPSCRAEAKRTRFSLKAYKDLRFSPKRSQLGVACRTEADGVKMPDHARDQPMTFRSAYKHGFARVAACTTV